MPRSAMEALEIIQKMSYLSVEQLYATDYFRHIHGDAPRPEVKDYGITALHAETIRDQIDGET